MNIVLKWRTQDIIVYVRRRLYQGRIFRFCSGGVPKIQGGGAYSSIFFYFELSEMCLSAFSAFA
jgi:hypothetical protein